MTVPRRGRVQKQKGGTPKINSMLPDENFAPQGVESQQYAVHDIDEAVGHLQRRLARLERERERAMDHALVCLLANVAPPAKGDLLIKELQKCIEGIKARLRDLEARRQEALLRELDDEEAGNE